MDAGDLVPDDLIVAHGGRPPARRTTPRTASSSTGSRARWTRPRRWTSCSPSSGRRVTAALLIDVPDEEVIRRLSGRRVCVKSGHNYHVEFDPPKHEGVCDQDGSRLIQRDDDKPEVIENRLRVYHEKTEPLVDYYDEHGPACADRRHPSSPPRSTTTSAR